LIFITSRRTKEVMTLSDACSFRADDGELMHGTAPMSERFNTFVAQLEPLNLATRCDLAGECLHYWDFERY